MCQMLLLEVADVFVGQQVCSGFLNELFGQPNICISYRPQDLPYRELRHLFV